VFSFRKYYCCVLNVASAQRRTRSSPIWLRSLYGVLPTTTTFSFSRRRFGTLLYKYRLNTTLLRTKNQTLLCRLRRIIFYLHTWYRILHKSEVGRQFTEAGRIHDFFFFLYILVESTS